MAEVGDDQEGTKVSDDQEGPESLGRYLAALRTKAGLSLRQVEDATEKEVSNAYLSQLEGGKIKKPDPSILFALAGVYHVPYEDLFRRAGYLSSQAGTEAKRRARAATFSIENVTPAEEELLLEYLSFLRFKRKNRDPS